MRIAFFILIFLTVPKKYFTQFDFGQKLNLFVSPSYYDGFGVTLTADYEIFEFGNGFTLAPSLGIGVSRRISYIYDINNIEIDSKYKPIFILQPGVTVYYYFDAVIEKLPEMLDFYTKLSLGFWFPVDEKYRDYSYHFPLTYAAFIGGRVHFNPKLSLNIGIGLNKVTANLGLTISL